MWRKNDGFLLYEVLFTLFVISVSLLFIMESMVFLRKHSQQNQDRLELAIFADEMVKFQLQADDEAVMKKCQNQGIQIIESGETQLILEKNGYVLNISKQ